MITSTITAIAHDWKASFDSYAIEVEKNIATWVKENAKEYGADRLNASICPAALSCYLTDFLFFFWEQVDQWVQAQGLDSKTYESVLKPSNGVHFKEAKSALYARVAKKHHLDVIKHLIDDEIARLRSENDEATY
jgi:hypothetical protein